MPYVKIEITREGVTREQKQILIKGVTDLISKTKLATNGKGLGVLYWEPEAYNNWQGYSLGAFDNSGKPTIALSAFQ